MSALYGIMLTITETRPDGSVLVSTDSNPHISSDWKMAYSIEDAEWSREAAFAAWHPATLRVTIAGWTLVGTDHD
jgi:hypothetical protein